MEPLQLSSPTALLRPHQPTDVPGMVEQCADPVSQRWTSVPSPYGTEDAEQFLQTIARGWAEETMLAFAVADPGTGDYLGTVDLRLDGTRGAEVGFGLRPPARGRGALTAALGTLADWALDPEGLDLEVLHWRAFVGNWPSRRVAWKVGFRIEGSVRSLLVQRGERRDAWVGSLRRGDPREPVNRWLAAAELAGGGVRLRPFRDSDADAVVEACTDPTTRHWLGGLPDPYTEEVALGYIRSREEQHATAAGVYWCAADTYDACVGSFGLMSIDLAAGSAEVGYWVHPAARGRGVATTAVRLVCAYAFGELGLRRVDLRAASTNAASRRVAERAGFRPTGTRRGAERLGDGSYADLVDYDLLATDQPSRPAVATH